MSEKRINPVVRENELEFLYDLHIQGINVGKEKISLLKSNGYIKETPVTKEKIINEIVNKARLNTNTDRSIRADALIDIVKSSEKEALNYDILTDKELEERRKKYGHIFDGRPKDKPILRYEWLPESTIEHTKEFIDWITSINQNGFSRKETYRPFTLYCQQAYSWLQENTKSSDYYDEDEREDYRQEELRRCDENALYFLNKYVWYKEGNAEDGSGRLKYIASPAHEFLAYMDDCGYSMGIAKGRQMAATTTLMALNVRDVVFKQNHFMKFITEDDEKAIEIFEDKLKYAFGELPDWMRPVPLNDRDNFFKIATKGEEKGKKEGVGSSIRLSVPKRTAIAGGAPQKVMIDEAGNIKLLGLMIGNARPTMMWFNPKTKKIEIKRVLVFLGTGGEMDKGGKAFETELMTIFKQWQDADYSSGIIPIFFDWTCRPGATQEDYDREKKVAYAKGSNTQDPAAKKHITEFHQTWPTSISDVFRASAQTLVDDEYIEAALTRIANAKKEHKFTLHQSGFFEPIYDETKPTDQGSDVPFKIIGAEFIPTSDIDRRASVTIFLHPKEGWTNRYYQGSDPIDTNSGLSNFSSAVWDKQYKTNAAILNWRIPNYTDVFLQALLLNLYYDTKPIKTGIPELLESNRGTSYYQYCAYKGYSDHFVLNYQLPLPFQTKSSGANEGVGIDNKGVRNTMLINNMTEMFKAYGMNFYHQIQFEQLKTFTCVVSDTGRTEMWGPINKKYFMDDTLWSGTFSYICSEKVFPELIPTNIEKIKNQTRIVHKLVRGADNKLGFMAVKEKVV